MNHQNRLEISMDQQTLDLFINNKHVRQYPISTSAKGMGSTEGSLRTPTGNFVISEMIGRDQHEHTIYKARVPIGRWDSGKSTGEDLILSRILQLDGCDPDNSNTLSRYIYIHGTNQEDLIGSPASQGCIRMSIRDMVDLFERVEKGYEVRIHPLTEQKGNLLFLDCDSTLSAIEGIDELARLSSPAIFAEVEALTHAAMNGEVPLNEVFKRRMEIIKPDQRAAREVSKMYLETVLPGVTNMIAIAKENGWLPVILSGGFAPLIHPLAQHLGIEYTEAVPLHFNELGEYQGYGENYPTTRNLGKNEVIREWRAAMLPLRTMMIGDGISDLETKTDVDLMIGFGGIIQREKVKQGADLWLQNFEDLQTLSSVLKS